MAKCFISQALTKLREPGITMEIVLWADMPGAFSLKRKLDKSTELRSEVERTFWMKGSVKYRIQYHVKPWSFADAKRPCLSIVLGKIVDTP